MGNFFVDCRVESLDRVRAAVDEIVFAEEGDLQLLGARTLGGLNLRVDAQQQKLVAAGPILAA